MDLLKAPKIADDLDSTRLQETTMKLYSGPLSLFTAKVRIALDEKSLAYERIDVGWTLAHRYHPHHPEVVALNPKREVPVLVDGDVGVYDSSLIFEYLEDRYPEVPLYPADPAERARCRQLEAAADEILFRPVWDRIEEVFYPAEGERDEARAECAREELLRQHASLDRELAGRDYLCDEFSVADIGTFIMLNAAATLGVPSSAEHLNLAAWLERTAARPAVQRESDAMQAFVARLFATAAASVDDAGSGADATGSAR
jgi:glutathione S-transferase